MIYILIKDEIFESYDKCDKYENNWDFWKKNDIKRDDLI